MKTLHPVTDPVDQYRATKSAQNAAEATAEATVSKDGVAVANISIEIENGGKYEFQAEALEMNLDMNNGEFVITGKIVGPVTTTWETK
jgi:hypothetical protein